MKRFTICAISATTIVAAFAAPVTPDEALSRAFDKSQAKITGQFSKFKLAHTEKYGTGNAVYIFSRENSDGFIITPADDCAPALLGYGDSKICDENGTLAPGFEYWIGELARQINYAVSHPVSGSPVFISRPQREAIEPLLQTKWNQSWPYNNNCPQQNNQNTVTGCVATAMSQVMKYHNWPDIGEGEISYRCLGKNLKINFARTIFKWDDMLNEYNSESSEDSQKAVATLMQAAGYSVQMNYSTTGSGAKSIDIAPALGNYFKYDKSLRYLMRDYYSLVEWEDLIYNSLKTYGPVIYDGQAGIGGHSFVCDGYSSDGYFHINWGWGGLSDGYFLLDTLAPEHQGIGGADGGFDYMQDIIIDIQPRKQDNTEWEYQMYASDYPDFDTESYEGYLSFNTSFYNYGPGPIRDAFVGYKFTNVDQPDAEPVYVIEQVVDENDNPDNIPIYYGFGGFSIKVPELDNGKYEVKVVYGSGDGNPRELLFPNFANGITILTVNGNSMSVTTTETEIPDFIDVVYPEKIDKNGPVSITGKLVNPNDSPYLCFMSVVILDNKISNALAYSTPRPVDLDAKETLPMNFEATIDQMARLADGYYYVGVAQFDYTTKRMYLISMPESVYIGKTDGIAAVFAEESQPVEYYTSDGIKVAETKSAEEVPALPSGLYIVRSGQKSVKIYVK